MGKVTLDHKFDIGNPVIVSKTYSDFNGKTGTVQNINILYRVFKESESYTEINYTIDVARNEHQTFSEEVLSSYNGNLHKDRFEVKEGQVVKLEDSLYVVETAITRIEHLPGDGPMSSGGNSIEEWRVVCRKLDKDGNYDSKGEVIEFDQNRSQALEIVDKLEKTLNFGKK